MPILIVEFGAAPQITWAVFFSTSHAPWTFGSQKPRFSRSPILVQVSYGAGVAIVGQVLPVTGATTPAGVFVNEMAEADDVASTPASRSALSSAAIRIPRPLRRFRTTHHPPVGP